VLCESLKKIHWGSVSLYVLQKAWISLSNFYTFHQTQIQARWWKYCVPPYLHLVSALRISLTQHRKRGVFKFCRFGYVGMGQVQSALGMLFEGFGTRDTWVPIQENKILLFAALSYMEVVLVSYSGSFSCFFLGGTGSHMLVLQSRLWCKSGREGNTLVMWIDGRGNPVIYKVATHGFFY